MRYKLLGKSGLRVSEVCLGTMTFGEEWEGMKVAAPRDECQKIFDAFAQAGGNFIDTANYYNFGSSEKYLADFIGAERERFVIATKYSLSMRPNDPNAGGNHRKNMVQSLEASLRRLKTDYIDLYWLHAWDFTTPANEVMHAFDDMVRAGKVLHIGISDTPAWIVAKANTIAQLRGWREFVGLQVPYSLVERAVERELLPMARDFSMSVAAWAPLGMGVLTGKYSKRNSTPANGRLEGAEHPHLTAFTSERSFAIAEKVQQLADELGRKPSQVALSWIRHKGAIPIVGARKAAQIVENIECVDLNLSADQVRTLDEVSRIEMGFPHDFLQGDATRGQIFGENVSRVDVTPSRGQEPV